MVTSTPTHTRTVSRPRVAMLRYSSRMISTPRPSAMSRAGLTVTPSVNSSPAESVPRSHTQGKVSPLLKSRKAGPREGRNSASATSPEASSSGPLRRNCQINRKAISLPQRDSP
jgi:hypothetical protein